MTPTMPISARLPIRSFLFVTLFCLSVLLGPGPLRAQSLSTIGGGGDGPVTVEAENGIEWLRNSRQYIARGNAKATQGEVTVFADRLIASYREAADGSTEIFQLEADGNVRIASPAQTAYGDRAVYDLDSQRMRLTGQDLRLVSAADTVTARDHIDYFQQEKMAVAVGDAVAKRDDRTIRADTLTARFAEDKSGKQQLTRVDADGNVVVTTPNEIAQPASCLYCRHGDGGPLGRREDHPGQEPAERPARRGESAHRRQPPVGRHRWERPRKRYFRTAGGQLAAQPQVSRKGWR